MNVVAQFNYCQADMNNDEFVFTWKHLSPSLTKGINELGKEEHFCDVTLVCDDQTQVQAHKIVLGACSPVLRKQLLNNPHSHPLLYLRGVNHQVMLAIIQYMYFGEAVVYQHFAKDFMKILMSLRL